jgi:hypothetical protein
VSIAARRFQRTALGSTEGSYPVQRAGALPLGSTSYSIPSSDIIYLATNGSDGNAGTQVAPKATLAAAITAVPSGGTIVVRAGVYAQAAQDESAAVRKSFTLQNYPGEVVWFDGSDPITGWTYDSGSGRWWASSTVEWSHDDPTSISGPLNPIATWPDMLSRDGEQLWLVSSNPTLGQFSVDYATNRVWVADDPNGHAMRITTRGRFLLIANISNVTVRGIGIRNFTYPEWGGTIQASDSASNCYFENIHMYYSSAIATDGDNHTTTYCTFKQTLVHAMSGNNGTDCEWSHNLSEGADWKLVQYHVAGALKITRHVRPIIKYNVIHSLNFGLGIWLDVSCYEPVIIVNKVSNANNTAIFIECTEKGIIANNYVDQTGMQTGEGKSLSSYNAGSQQYWNNYVENADDYNIHIGGDMRRNSATAKPSDQAPGIPWQDIPWYAQNIVICNNVVGRNNVNFQFGGTPDGVDMATALTHVEGNLVYGNQAGGTANSGLFRWYNGSVATVYTTWTALNGAHGSQGFGGNAMTPTLHPLATEISAAASAVGVPLPSEVASVLGVPVGIVAIGPILPAPIAA